MRTGAGWVVAVVILVGLGVRDGRAEPRSTCIELHCFCDGPDEPDTVASCNTTCEEVCSSSGPGGGGAAAVPAIRLARWSLTLQLGPSFTSRDTGGGESTPDGGSYGVELEGHFGRRTFGILWRVALTSTPVEGAAAGLPRERALVLDWFSLGLEVSPRVARGPSWELRPTAALWVTSSSLVACDGCEAAAGARSFTTSYGGNALGARLGCDLYLGRRRQRGIRVAVVYSRLQVGDASGVVFSGTPTEHQAPPLMLQVGLTSM